MERAGDVLRLTIPPTTRAAYTDAQLDDYEHALPRRFANRPPQRLRLHARFSHPAGALKGTAGFGFWNHPFTRDGAVLEPPCNVWFFYSSPESDIQIAPGAPGHGFKAASLRTPLPSVERQGASGGLARAMMAAGNLALRLPGVSALAMAAARLVVRAREALLDLDMTEWHCYELDWLPDVAVFRVDGAEVLRAPSPRGPLGFVAWVDNYRAVAARDGQYAFAYVDVPEAQWLELEVEN
ncbi:MAG: hypothetical protein D6709_08515 [Chloroflexi bacterium]|uniref:GH16 domain-containing protein n=1 Tax=Candidatus Thermofonsia Clade 3 bacterium TaxID=2364212 RepID=A0A2M8QGP3_9CHLR|nr:MAG: hypothetical protein CUN48_00520 [Candidatus Thermofonsia Clade 3 bacterium]RMG63434.1 MAG: hypothetical protein D6709_08515 [Chloroflexota bacterium]